MGYCPVYGCRKPTEFFVVFSFENGVKSLVGCYCGIHAEEKKLEYEGLRDRDILLLDEIVTRENAKNKRTERR